MREALVEMWERGPFQYFGWEPKHVQPLQEPVWGL